MRQAVAALALVLGACTFGSTPRADSARYDLGTVEGSRSGGARIDVAAPVWLDTDAMEYRLAEDPARRRAFAASRWVAPPAELLAGGLRRQVGATGSCALKLQLDEFVQSFDSGGQSRAVVSLQAILLSGQGRPIGHRTFYLEEAAGTDAKSAVTAYARLLRRLADGLNGWLDQTAVQCRG